jgi:hypothetical protein
VGFDNKAFEGEGAFQQRSTECPIIETLITTKVAEVQPQQARLTLSWESPCKNHRIGSSEFNLTCEGLLLGMWVKGHGGSKTEAHPRLRNLMNLRSGTRDHTHTHPPSLLFAGPRHRDGTLIWLGGHTRGHPHADYLHAGAKTEVISVPLVIPTPAVSRWQRGPSRRSSMCRRSS